MKHSNTVILRLSHAIVIAGQIVGTGRLIEVTRSEAMDLLNRGRAVLHQDDCDDDDVLFSGGNDSALHPEVAAFQTEGRQAAQDGRNGAADSLGEESTGSALQARPGRAGKSK